MGATGYSKSNISHPNPKIGSAQKSILLIFDVIGQETRNFQVADKLFWIWIWLGLGLGLDLEFVLTHTRNWFSGLLYYCDYLVIWFMDRFLPLISLFLSLLPCYVCIWFHLTTHTVTHSFGLVSPYGLPGKVWFKFSGHCGCFSL